MEQIDWYRAGIQFAAGAMTDRVWPLSNRAQLIRDAAVAAIAAGKTPAQAKVLGEELAQLLMGDA